MDLKKKYFSNELSVIENTLPTFVIHVLDNKTVAVKNSLNHYEELKKKNEKAELHIFKRVDVDLQ